MKYLRFVLLGSLLWMAAGALHAEKVRQKSFGPYSVQIGSDGKIAVKYQGTTLVNYEMLQVVDLRKGWKVVYAYGKSGRVKLTRTMKGEAAAAHAEESLPRILMFEKEMQASVRGVSWALDYEIPAGAPATANYYFIDIPMAACEGGVYLARTASGPQFGLLSGRGGILQSGLKSLRLITAKLKIDFDLGGENVDWLLTDWTQSTHKSYRLRIEKKLKGEAVQAKLRVRLEAASSSREELKSVVAEAKKQDESRRRARFKEAGLVDERPLRLGKISANTEQVPRGAKLELVFDLAATFDNPFDPEQVDARAEFQGSKGKTLAIPAFFYQEFRRGEKGPAREGKPDWRVRFSPSEAGTYRYRVLVTNEGKTVASNWETVQCLEAEAPGPIRVSKSNGLFFQFESGRPYFPIGFNLFIHTPLGQPLPANRLATCRKYLNRLADNGGNFARFRMDSWWNAIEMTPDLSAGYFGLGYYQQQSCWEADRIYDTAARRGIYLMHCLDNANGSVNGSHESWRRPFNLYLKENGGVCESPDEFWTSPAARRAVRNKLRYCVARWGYHPNLFCWEFWNEVTCRTRTIKAATGWHRDMARFLRSIDPYRHPISTSLMGDHSLAAQIWNLPEMEIVQYHLYRRKDIAAAARDMVLKNVRLFRKPLFVGEFGIGPGFGPSTYDFDKAGVNFHNGLWASAMSLGAGAAAYWYVQQFIDGRNFYGQFRPLADFVRHIPWTSPELKLASPDTPSFLKAPGKEHFSDFSIPASERFVFEKPPVTKFRIGVDGQIANLEMIRPYLHCSKARKAPPTFLLQLHRPAEFVVSVNLSVGDATNRLVISLDGKKVKEEAFPAGKEFGAGSTYVEIYDNWKTPYRKSISVQVPEGTHRIRPEAFGKDRLEVNYILRGAISFERSSPLRAIGMQTGVAAWLWFQNRQSTWWSAYRKLEVISLQGMVTTVRDLADGDYQINWWDSWKGNTIRTETGRSQRGQLQLNIPPVKRDLAVEILRK